MVSRRGLLSGAALVGAGAMTGVVGSAGSAAAEAPLDTPFTPVATPHLAEAERMVQYQRLLAAGHLPVGLAGHWPLDGSGADRAANSASTRRTPPRPRSWTPRLPSRSRPGCASPTTPI
jgi:hypothetical protein